jgi:carboxyl-terminal processing protease
MNREYIKEGNTLRSYNKIHISLLSIVLVFTLLLAPAQAAVLDDVRALIKAAYVDPVDDSVLQAESVEDLLEKLNDPHSVFFTPEQYRAFKESIGDSSFSGIGVQIDSVPEGILIINVVPASPAEKANLKPGDIIISVNGISLTGMTLEEAVPIIRGPENSTVKLLIKRGESNSIISILRKTVVVPSVRGNLLLGNIGYIDIDSFGSETPGEFRQVLENLESEGAQSYIIDLRNNSGGYLAAALDIAGYFIGADTAINVETKNTGKQYYSAFEHAYLISKPTIFLVNEFSASASEILAAAVKDHDKALILGNSTFGKGTVQTVYQLISGQGYLKLTTARFFSPNGDTINNIGVSPHLLINESDPLKAAQLLLGNPLDSDNLILKIGKSNYQINTQLASTPSYWSAYKEIISQLPEYTLYRLSKQSDWQVADSHQLAESWSFYYPNYIKLSHLEAVPEDKQFSITFPQAVDKKTVNKDTFRLINANSGQPVPLDFLFLGSRQVLLTPKTKLEADNTYWLLILTEDTSNITIINVGSVQNKILVAAREAKPHI